MRAKLVTAREAADITRRAVETVQSWVRQGRLKAAGEFRSNHPRYPRVRHLYPLADVLLLDRVCQRRRVGRKGAYRRAA